MSLRRASTNLEEKASSFSSPSQHWADDSQCSVRGMGATGPSASSPALGQAGRTVSAVSGRLQDGMQIDPENREAEGIKTKPEKILVKLCSRGWICMNQIMSAVYGLCMHTFLLFDCLTNKVHWDAMIRAWSALTKSSRMITAEAEATEKFLKGVIKKIFPKIFISA